MKVTFLELYNEEITDLLALDESKFSEDKSKKPIALMEDGKGGVFVRGLEEEVVYTASEIYKILDKGSTKRRTAETLLNKQSSRSHSIFSITIHIKECTPEGEEMIKCGKLNLVDLAGSENISRSGARDVSKAFHISGTYNPLLLSILTPPKIKKETFGFCPFFHPSEVFAAREKHGIYIPRDRFLIEEAEKKVGLQMLFDHLYSFSEKIHYYHAFTRLKNL
ncbi:hypothetical protein B296_00043079 [Ensete ventricosum]|uniref:Kinesin motor domain-containing protein n=1 Tax=Ensete ventricosum TaxID=4639 RepID=A0A426ZBB9_ENSVE|nr:hypothetical protein B296_00043079 [Ensete ventricosum]